MALLKIAIYHRNLVTSFRSVTLPKSATICTLSPARVENGALSPKLYAFSDAFYYAYTLLHYLERMLDRNIPLIMFTDSKSLLKL